MNYIENKIKELGFEKITPIQEKTFKAFKDNKNIVGLAPTGTGKTHAYLLPIFSQIKKEIKETQAIILVPTNELVIQVTQMARQLDETISIKSYYGSIDKQRELEWLKNNQPQLVITTPSKLYEYAIANQALNIHTANYFVLDEADMMFDEEFLSFIDATIEHIEPKILLFSATITKQMEPFIQKYFGSSIIIDTTKEHDLKIDHYLVKIKTDKRLETLLDVTEGINPYLAFIFVSKKEDQQHIFEKLRDKGLNVVNFSSDLNVKQRKRLIDDIHKLKYQYIVASDLASRGIDFKASHVIHYDLPYHLEYFKHRSGRTGRMDSSGVVITLFENKDSRKIDKLKKDGVNFKLVTIDKDGIKVEKPKEKPLDKEIVNAVKSIKKSKKVKPNHKKKYQREVKKTVNKIKRSRMK
ncbi:MAG: DEAD/DEAH box helicase [Candidatus Phytoplasma sp.]|nr:DEAD/DEAH box helicase [Phytoplasma sp.]